MVGTRSGKRTSIIKKKETMNNVAPRKEKNVEINRHGVRVKGMTSGKSADGKSGGAQPKKSSPTKASIYAKQKEAIKAQRKAFLSIQDITGPVSSSESSEDETVVVSNHDNNDAPHKDQDSVSPIELPHEMITGILEFVSTHVDFATEQNFSIDVLEERIKDSRTEKDVSVERDSDNLVSFLASTDPRHADAILGILDLSKTAEETVDDVLAPSTDAVKDDPTNAEGSKQGVSVTERSSKKTSAKRKTPDDDVVLASLVQKGKKKKSGKDKSPEKEKKSVISKVSDKKKKQCKLAKDNPTKRKQRQKVVVEDAEDILSDIQEEEEFSHHKNLSLVTKKSVKGQKLPKNVPQASLDNVSFHTEDRVGKWRYAFHRSIFP